MTDVKQIKLFPGDAKVCLTVAGQVFFQKKLLLVLHRKLNVWLAPGGHLESNELPHLGAQREVFEETGVTVRAIDPRPLLKSSTSLFVPSPIFSNLHWVSKENYRRRLKDGDNFECESQWSKGCEQHLNLVYLMEVVGSTRVSMDERESLDVGWFTSDEISSLQTTDELRQEFEYGFRLTSESKTK